MQRQIPGVNLCKWITTSINNYYGKLKCVLRSYIYSYIASQLKPTKIDSMGKVASIDVIVSSTV